MTTPPLDHSPEHDLSNRDVVEELESWRVRNWFTPSNVVAMIAFIVTATVYYMQLDNAVKANDEKISAVDAKLMAEKDRRISQIDKTEQRLDKRIEKLEVQMKDAFREQKTDLKNIEQLLIQMLRNDQ